MNILSLLGILVPKALECCLGESGIYPKWIDRCHTANKRRGWQVSERYECAIVMNTAFHSLDGLPVDSMQVRVRVVVYTT